MTGVQGKWTRKAVLGVCGDARTVQGAGDGLVWTVG